MGALLVVAAAALLGPGRAGAQTGQRLSLQASGIYADLYGSQYDSLKAGTGVELQLRYTPGAVSWGAGVQYTMHGESSAERDGHDPDIKLLGIFVEPRYVIDVGRGRAVPYVSGRFALARFDGRINFSDGDVLTFTSNGVTLNGGGGVLVSLTRRVNLDLGATLGYSNYEDTEGSIEGPVSGTGSFDMEMKPGLNAVARIGLAIGIGR